MDKEKLIKAKVKSLKKIFENIGDDSKDLVDDLIGNAAFMAVSLSELQDQINTNGMISHYQNGANQWGTKKAPEVEIYATMIKQYSNVMKQLIDLIPEGSAPDELADFLKGKQFR